MNRFKIILGKESNFEKIWKERDTHLDKVKGFTEFHLLKGQTTEEYTLYSSHTVWSSKNDFLNWTKSEEFQLAHKDAGRNSSTYIGHPEFEGFDVIL